MATKDLARTKGLRYLLDGYLHTVHTTDGLVVRGCSHEDAMIEWLNTQPDDPDNAAILAAEEAEELANNTGIGEWVAVTRVTEEVVFLRPEQAEAAESAQYWDDLDWELIERSSTFAHLIDGREISTGFVVPEFESTR